MSATVKTVSVSKYECRRGHIHNDYHAAVRCSETPGGQQERDFQDKACSHCIRQWYSPEFGSTGCGVTEDEQGWKIGTPACMKWNEDRARVECDEYIPGGELYRRWGGRKVKDPKEKDVCSPQEIAKRKGKTVGLNIVGSKEYRRKSK